MYETVGKKDDQGKLQTSLVPVDAWLEVLKVLQHGANKYGAENWRKISGLKERYYNAGNRHRNLQWWATGEKLDSESKLHHLAHSICCDLFILQTELEEEIGKQNASKKR